MFMTQFLSIVTQSVILRCDPGLLSRGSLEG
jgi:hypothetical protein